MYLAIIATMDNKERNQTILEAACGLLEQMNVEVKDAFAEDIEDEQVLVSLVVDNPANLIGFRGRNLAAIQIILGLVVKNKLGDWVRVLLDINNYRNEQKARLESMAKNLAQKVLDTGVPVAMASMSSYERRICHMTLQEIEGISSESEGEGDERHIVIKLSA